MYPKVGRRENVVTIVATRPVAGMKMMYTPGCAKNQKRCCQSSASPLWFGSKKWVFTSRSRINAVLAIITAGMAKITMKEITTSDQTKIGTRLSDIPGVRILKAVVMTDTATARLLTSV